MKSLSKIFPQINRLATICAAAAISLAAYADSIPVSPWKNLTWKVGAELSGGYVPGTNAYLKGMNSLEKRLTLPSPEESGEHSHSIPIPRREWHTGGSTRASE